MPIYCVQFHQIGFKYTSEPKTALFLNARKYSNLGLLMDFRAWTGVDTKLPPKLQYNILCQARVVSKKSLSQSTRSGLLACLKLLKGKMKIEMGYSDLMT